MQHLDKKAVLYFTLIQYARALPLLLLIPISIFLSYASTYNQINYKTSVLTIVGSILLLIAILLGTWIIARLTYKYYRYELQDDVVRIEHGIIWKRYSSIPYDRIQNVDILRGLVARLVGVSDLQIQTAGGAIVTEGRLPALSPQVAEQLRDEILKTAKTARSPQGL